MPDDLDFWLNLAPLLPFWGEPLHPLAPKEVLAHAARWRNPGQKHGTTNPLLDCSCAQENILMGRIFVNRGLLHL